MSRSSPDGPASCPSWKLLSDARWVGAHGIGRFAREVLARLPRHAQLATGPKPLSLADAPWLTWRLLAARPEVFFSPGFNPPPLCRARLVFTIHDLIQIRMPGVATSVKRFYYERVVKPACSRAFRVLTVSEYSRAQIVEWSGIPAGRVVNVGNGVGPPFEPEGPRSEPGFPYILYVGNFRPHKNVHRLLLAFRTIDWPELRLLLTGAADPSIIARLEQFGIRDRTRFVNAASDAGLARLYRGAACVVLPSLIEGFGLPALEAMACGTPAVVSQAASLPEVAGGAAVLADPLDADAIRRGIERVLGDRELRQSLRRLGLERAKQFSWDRVAASVRSVLEEAGAAS